MSIANWNAITQYLIGDQVYDGSADYYVATADNINSNPPSANWTLIAPPGAGVVSLNALSGNLTLVGAGRTLVSPGVPGVSDIQISSVVGYGSWYSQTTQVLADAAGAGAGVPVYMTYDFPSVPPGFGVVLTIGTGGGTSALRVGRTGIYQLTTSLQLDKFGGGGTNNFQVWVAVNGTPVPWTNSESTINNAISTIFTCDYMLSLNLNDRVEVVAYVPVGSDHCQVLAVPVDVNHPVEIPSIITNIVLIE